MSLEEYREAWKTGNEGVAAREECEKVARDMRLRDRRQRFVLGACAINTVIGFLLVAWILTNRGPVDWNEIAPVLLLQVVLAVALAALMKSRRRRRRELDAGILSVREAAAAGIAGTESELRDIRKLAGIACIAAGLLAVAAFRLKASGKMDDRSVAGFGLMVATVIVLNGTMLWRRRSSVLLPRRSRLRQILAGLD